MNEQKDIQSWSMCSK